MGRRAEAEAEAENSERWLLTYADMITLLLALFVVLFAMSSISQKKFDEFKTGLLQTFSQMQLQSALKGGSGLLQHRSLITHPGVTPGPPQISIPQTGAGTPSSSSQQSSQIAAKINAALSKANLSSDVQVAIEKRGVVVRLLSDKVFFNTDSASLGSVGSQVVNIIGSVVKPLSNDIVVEGYTDSAPIYGGPFSSNFELSAVRAVTVLEQLMHNDGVSASRLSATGFGATHPIVPNSNPTNMALNRRVDVVILNTQTTNRL
ncbi:flagellar motor protein MotB [Ferrimicrobium acidiphilum]|jgi:chemotaxis protein MotB|uniref:Motility protein B n=1 Tax=Ferrimicrobium acidiphilum DSM 19497 TaxID=1121877 RepID=A0A0D8FTI2_9ACTN|nr:flagellar motor protein MotB [Ferrimicrobium acidiphilum]KJE76593.1 motility protein B [Ferrimicrobium acidiphilum DSM 19497]MCL5053929.1 OmpA family protein [Gammaproteobacteria bacterium]